MDFNKLLRKSTTDVTVFLIANPIESVVATLKSFITPNQFATATAQLV